MSNSNKFLNLLRLTTGAALGMIFLAGPVLAYLPSDAQGRPVTSLAPMLEKVTPAVVNVATEGRVQLQYNPLFNDPFFRRFFNLPDQPPERRTESLGSGVIIDAEKGLVVTNHHVIANADQITVGLADGRKLKAELVGSDEETDVAVIKVSAKNLTALKLADSEELRVGDFVVAIGNPFGLGQTVTSGIISALGRTNQGIVGYEDFIQTDASINPGNSGGALVNLNGELVGINTAILSRTGGNIGIGFAIPINMALRVTEQLVEHGKVERGFIGAQLQDLDPDLAEAFGLDQQRGAVIVAIIPDGPAAKAGLKAGDVVLEVNGEAVDSAADVRNRVGLMRVGERATLKVLRDGRPRTIVARVGEQTAASAGEPGYGPMRNERLAGATFGDIPADSPEFGQIQGVLVFEVEPDSRAWQNGLREGDIVTSVNRVPVADLSAFLRAVNNQTGNLLLRIKRGPGAAFLVMK